MYLGNTQSFLDIKYSTLITTTDFQANHLWNAGMLESKKL